jgi:tetratricopeptide (TPR) repeat protein
MSDYPRLEELKRRVQQDPASIAFAALAEEFRRLGLFHDAIETCRAGLLRHPAYLSARVTLGRALLEVGEYDEAQSHLEQVVRVAPDNLAAIRALADIHHRRGDAPDGYAAETSPPAAPAASAAAVPAPTPAPPLAPAAPPTDKPIAVVASARVLPIAPHIEEKRPVFQSAASVELMSPQIQVATAVDPVCERLEQFLAAIDRARVSGESSSAGDSR